MQTIIFETNRLFSAEFKIILGIAKFATSKIKAETNHANKTNDRILNDLPITFVLGMINNAKQLQKNEIVK